MALLHAWQQRLLRGSVARKSRLAVRDGQFERSLAIHLSRVFSAANPELEQPSKSHKHRAHAIETELLARRGRDCTQGSTFFGTLIYTNYWVGRSKSSSSAIFNKRMRAPLGRSKRGCKRDKLVAKSPSADTSAAYPTP